MENLFHTTQEINKLYGKTFAEKMIDKPDLFDTDEFIEEQGIVFVLFEPQYTVSYNLFQSLIFLLPEDVIDATMDYYQYMVDLFEEENDDELGIKLKMNLNQKVFEVINAIRNHIAIDTLTDETRKLLSKGSQLKFIDEDEMEDFINEQN